MNIKGLISNILPIDPKPISKIERAIKADEAHERDANGQQLYDQSQQQNQQEPMTDEQIEKALEHLRSLPACKEHKWSVVFVKSEGDRHVLVKDNLGNLIRKIPEAELRSLPVSSEQPKGQLLKRSA